MPHDPGSADRAGLPRAGRRVRLHDRGRQRAELEVLARRMWVLRIVAWCMFPVVLGLVWLWSADWIEHRGDQRFPLVHGTVESVATVKGTWNIPRPELTIRIDDSGELVRARLSLDGAKHFTDRSVSFHYDGDPSREVQLVGEMSPLLVGLLLLGLATASVVVAPFAVRHYRRKLQRLDEQGAADR